MKKSIINVSSTNSTLCAQPCYHQTVETHSCVSASCQVFAIGDFIRQSCLLRRKNASLQLFVEFTLIISLCAACLLSGCDTYTGMGAYSGAALGSVLGSAIGGLSGGPRGSDMGTLIGMAGGAAVGASIGSAADAKAERQRQDDVYRYREYRKERKRHSLRKERQDRKRYRYDDERYNEYQGGGDDRIYDMGIPGPDGR